MWSLFSQQVSRPSVILHTPNDSTQHRFYYVFLDSDSSGLRFHYQSLGPGDMYVLRPHYVMTRLIPIWKYVPEWVVVPYLYWRVLPFFYVDPKK